MAVRVRASDRSRRKPDAPDTIAVTLPPTVHGASRWLTTRVAIPHSKSHAAQARLSVRFIVQSATVGRWLRGRRSNNSFNPNPLRCFAQPCCKLFRCKLTIVVAAGRVNSIVRPQETVCGTLT